jgi:hypothetical protein
LLAWRSCHTQYYKVPPGLLFIAYVYAVLPHIAYDLAVDIRLSERDGQLFEFVGRLVRPDPADLFPSIVRATPFDFALGASWLALVGGLLLLGIDRRRQTG